MSDDSYLKELKDSAKIDGKLNIKILKETYYLAIRAGLSKALCMECHTPIDFALQHGHPQGLYCSEECKKALYSRNKPPFEGKKNCIHCGVVFFVENKKGYMNRKYCREQCATEAMNKRKLVERMKYHDNFNNLRDRLERNMKTWKEGKGIECLECGKLFVGKASKKFCCDQPCGQTYRRRQKKNGVR